MIVIHSSANDPSTPEVMDWLAYLKNDEKIAYFNDTLTLDHLSIFIGNNKNSKSSIAAKGQLLNINDIKSSWYRRGEFVMPVKSEIKEWAKISATENNCVLNLIDELVFPYKTSINKFSDVFISKLQCLSLAESMGLSIPATLVTTQFNTLQQFANEMGSIILKPIGTPFFEIPLNERYIAHVVNRVSLVSHEQIIALKTLYPENVVQPTLAQEYIEKKWEIRSLYLNNTFYSMAIFSQQNEKTRIDFRNYDNERPNRFLPFKLPEEIEERLRNLMAELKINSGSFDIIYTPAKEYVFLEVNPIGQYQWLSHNCNYFVDRAIADTLLKNSVNNEDILP